MRNKPINVFDKQTLFTSFMDNTMFSIFFDEIKYLAAIVRWLEGAELPTEQDEDDNEIENQVLRKIFAQLKVHIMEPKFKIGKEMKLKKASVEEDTNEESEQNNYYQIF